MPTCPWCEKSVGHLVQHDLPDDDFVEVCVQCAVEEEEAHERRYSLPRVKTKDRTYTRV